MRALFNPNSKVHLFLGKVVDLVLLNVLFFISSLPIITIGCSLLALNKVSSLIVEDAYSSVTVEYWYAFKANLKRGFQVTLLIVISLLGLGLSFYYNQLLRSTHQMIGAYGILIYSILFILLLIHLLPYLARYDDTFIHSIKVSLQIAFLNLSNSFKIIGFLIGMVILSLISNLLFVIGSLVFIFMGMPLLACLLSKTILPVFRKYE